MAFTRRGTKGSASSKAKGSNNSYLGTLRSEFDEPETTPEGFIKLQDNVSKIRDKFLEGVINERQAAELLGIQKCSDLNGGEWTVGATTGSWYRRQGAETPWMRVPSPSQAVGNPLPGAWQRTIVFPEKNDISVNRLGVLDANDMLGAKEINQSDKSGKDLSEDTDFNEAMKIGPRTENENIAQSFEIDPVVESKGPKGGVFSGIEDYFIPPTTETK